MAGFALYPVEARCRYRLFRPITHICILNSDMAIQVISLKSLLEHGSNVSFKVPGEGGGFILILANCILNSEISMTVQSTLYNLDNKTGRPDFLPAVGSFVEGYYFLAIYTLLAAAWKLTLYKSRAHESKVHMYMLLFLLFKVLDSVLQAKNRGHIKRTGTTDTKDWVFHNWRILQGPVEMLLIVHIMAGERKMQIKDVVLLNIITRLQLAGRCSVIGLYNPSYLDGRTRAIFNVVNQVGIFVSALLPIDWTLDYYHRQLGNLSGRATTLRKFTLFESITSVIYFSVFLSLVCPLICSITLMSHVSTWRIINAFVEALDIAFFGLTGCIFRPEMEEEVLPIDVEAEGAAMQRRLSSSPFLLVDVQYGRKNIGLSLILLFVASFAYYVA